MDKRDRANLLTDRLRGVLATGKWSLSALGRAAGIDRTTITQLLEPDAGRMPNSHVLANLAEALGVSTDWLLGLAEEPGGAAEILDASVHITRAARTPFDETVMSWYREAEGRKIRHVPAGLPDLLKTDAVLRHEWRLAPAKTPRQAIIDARDKLNYARLPEVDMELAMPKHALEVFCQGAGQWEGLSAESRREQLTHMAELTEELYPRLRLYLFDLRKAYCAPIGVYGGLRAVVYVGDIYLVFTSKEHIRALSSRFDTLVRDAAVRAHDVPARLRAMVETVC
ncbi:MAG: helix-turn-helix domain-containing protein [Alphaproteobacteria bacterium]|nr:helix-turn-helix domain-containing protein [Alphaproteobacteria bacterium]MBU0796865.1 helix-turn-helix domain-containing protein [Alphaproteobacteria bacterium]MBU0889112.1 helix-turn-helix domain-containing protein [Alphaproteobacteria bacterium]MBU1812146.1 helix-turn-helix domain-containing protein [Alphaproteobacteria bacterium]MBU2091892.1 helix-turn-helix domain-containing protein [Alphaproteobacteria bacterium]